MDGRRDGAVGRLMERRVVMEDGCRDGREEGGMGGQKDTDGSEPPALRPHLGVVIELAELLVSQDLVYGWLGHPVQPCQEGARLEFRPSSAGLSSSSDPGATQQPNPCSFY